MTTRPALPREQANLLASIDRTTSVRVRIAGLHAADSPRLGGEDLDHVRALAEVEEPLPPIVVHRSTMRVIDGMHRLRAAELRGDDTIEVQFSDESEELTFALAVECNVRNGLPLSLRDRKAAAERITAVCPQWSDRSIAACTGLSAKTVAAIRGRVAPDRTSDPAGRIGRDGKVRPLDIAEGRTRAAQVIRARPDASIREIAGAAGVSMATAHDVRARLRRGEDPVPARGRKAQEDRAPEDQTPRRGGSTPVVVDSDTGSILQNLKKDPSLRFSDAGRDLLRWLDTHLATPQDAGVIRNAPLHCTSLIAVLARVQAQVWRDFAEQLEQREHHTA
ncbi:ParB/RepB/Spo0J family partition protein [Actinophytocola oryzae]|uniref:ParB-like nuclease family protein n=1 Tax=Actinophytocola oryzae TaxID=502181 RepID=A0A4R7VJW8_9PSEU|nr:ParB/RepB/Spo0J family partition protein [Actinophytocola oryzae]TDV49766.1 ParB-like nuclease family protein [Actinophytocola oryzae]